MKLEMNKRAYDGKFQVWGLGRVPGFSPHYPPEWLLLYVTPDHADAVRYINERRRR